LGKFKDLTGQRFGRLVVQYRNEETKKWHCLCDCGNETEVAAGHLNAGSVSSCGCSKIPTDLVGKRFGRLTVQYYDIKKKKWYCICDCGGEKYTDHGSLIRGLTRSCGCLHKEAIHNAKFKDETGNKYNMLTVISLDSIKKDKSGHARTYWLCRCDCGNEVVVSRDHLGRNLSCGCLDISHAGSTNENKLVDFVSSIVGKDKIILHSRKAINNQEIDIYIPSYRLGIEYCGSAFHATNGSPFKNKNKYYHMTKFLLAKSYDIHLITVFDVDFEADENRIYDIIKNVIEGKEQAYDLTSDIVYTDNDYDSGESLRKYGYLPISQTEPDSFIYGNRFLVYRCGRTKWKRLT